LEEALAQHLRVRHAVVVSSCTAGLMLAYRGLVPRGEVGVPSFTFMATVGALVWAGLRPVFADVDEKTTNLDPAAAEEAITPSTRAIVAIHNFGNPAPIQQLEAVAERRGLKLVFDAAHGFGSLYRGVPVGSQGDAQVFSMSPTKLVVAGEGGVVTTNDDGLAHRIRLGREYGNDGSYDPAFAGMNARMPELNALIGLASLGMLEQVVAHRHRLAALYREQLGSVAGLRFLSVHPDDRCSYKDFSLFVEPAAFGIDRDQLALALAMEEVETRKYYRPPVHRQRAYRRYANGTRLPRTDRLADQTLCLPIGTHLDEASVVRICGAIRRIQRFAPRVRSALEQSAVRRQAAV